ncbi:hypothetical protein FSP39_018977 [Pinctada imbricata]|uniref:Uncharacterized protein n=1 Tax=Pinctada imbricata TaxID=66713 RepID=A0AA88XTE8_PINIB|nr:hypothetical protein FSP39_018977 [Pinctada imbricata]
MVCCGTGLTNAVAPVKGYSAYLGLWLGDPHRLVYGVDSWGNVCGRKSNKQYNNVPLSGRDLSNEINLFYFDKDIFVDYKPGSFIHPSKTAVCVKSCPSTVISTSEALRNFSSTSGSKLCRYDVSLNQYTGGSSDALGECPPLPIEEQYIINTYRCLPKSLSSPLELLTGAIDSLFNKIDENFSKKCLSDLESTWKEICYLSALAVGVSLVIVILLRFIAAIVIWLMVAVLAVGSVAATVVCW